MIFHSKTMNKRLGGFTLIEVLVSITIISIAILSTLSVFTQISKQVSSDDEERAIYSLIESKFVTYQTADDVKSILFSREERNLLSTNHRWPVFAPLIQTNIGNHSLLISRKIRRWEPLLVDVGMEAIFHHNGKGTNAAVRHYWVESTFSGSVRRLYDSWRAR